MLSVIFCQEYAVFWDVAPRKSYMNRRFGWTYRLHLQGRIIRERGTWSSRWHQTQLNCWVKLLLVLASEVIPRSKSRGTHDHVFLSPKYGNLAATLKNVLDTEYSKNRVTLGVIPPSEPYRIYLYNRYGPGIYPFFRIFFSVVPQPLPGLGLLFGFLIFYTHIVGLLGWVISSSQDLYLHRTTQT
jgi:hypothetical protein